MNFFVICFIIFAFCAALFSGGFSSFYNQHTETCTVTDKDRGYDHNTDSSKYRVYTKQCGPLENTDSILRGKFNSADIQGQLEDGKTYSLTVVGPRIPIFSKMPNILSVN